MELEVSAAATATRITHARQSSSACQRDKRDDKAGEGEGGREAASIAVGDAGRG